MGKDELLIVIRKMAEDHGLDPALVAAVVEQESSWIATAKRYEASFESWLRKRVAGLTDDEYRSRSTSWGLMQVMGQTAVEQGFSGEHSEMHSPLVGIEQGCIKLKKCLNIAGGDVRKALLCYNGGGNERYPDEVMARMEKYA
jgi:soluble lytic murein transglycosylase-like protein